MTPAPNSLVGVDRREDDGRVTVALRGEIDLSNVALVEKALTAALADADAGDRLLVVDLSQLLFMDSSGLQALCALREQAIRRAVGLALVRGPRQIHRIFELTSTDRLFDFTEPMGRAGLEPATSALSRRRPVE